MPDLVLADRARDARRLVIADGVEPHRPPLGVVQVRPLQAQAEPRDERRRPGHRRDPLPEPVAHRERPDAPAERLEVRPVQREVAELFPLDREEAPPEGERRVREGEQGPGEQLRGLELVVQEGREERDPLLGARERRRGRRLGRARDDPQLGRAAGPVEPEGRRRGELARRGRRRELVREARGRDVVVRPALDGASGGDHRLGSRRGARDRGGRCGRRRGARVMASSPRAADAAPRAPRARARAAASRAGSTP